MKDDYQKRHILGVKKMNNAKVDREIEAEIVTLRYDEKIEVLQEIKNFKKKNVETFGAPAPQWQKLTKE